MPTRAPEKKLLIAVVDDHTPFCTSICRLLEGRGYGARAFSSVAEFIGSGIFTRIHCLLLDVNMPEIDGLALQECLRQTNYHVPIIFCTGQDDDEARDRAFANGAASFLKKPVDADGLFSALHSALNNAEGKSPAS